MCWSIQETRSRDKNEIRESERLDARYISSASLVSVLHS